MLDACCGAGTLSGYLSTSGMRVTGVDNSPSMLALARRKVPGVRFVEEDLSQLELAESVDGAVIALSLHEMHEGARSAVWDAIKQATRPGGTLIVLDYISLTEASPLSKVARWLIWKDEQGVGKEDPGHFRNFQDFMALGGARAWLLNHNESIREERRFLCGNLGVIVIAT